MLKIKVIFIFMAVFVRGLFFARAAWAATYYVDYVGGHESAAGTSPTTDPATGAWKYCPGDPRANTGHTLSNGDIIYFKRQATAYEGSGQANWAISTKTDGVTYTVTSWGTGDATIDAGASGTPAAAFEVIHSNITIDGEAGKNLALTGAAIGHAAIWCYSDSGLSGNKFTRLKIQNVGTAASEEGIGIKIGGNDQAYTNMEISYNNISSCYSAGIKISGNGTRGNIFGNDIQGSGQLPGERCQVNISSSYSNGIEMNFYNNSVHDSGSTMVNGINVNGAGSKLYNNSFYNNTGAGIAVDPLYCPNNAGTTDIYKNIIKNNSPAGSDEGIRIGSGSATLYTRIWNNLIHNNGTNNYQIRTMDGVGYTKIWNNTIYTSNGTGGVYHYGTASNTEIKNNLISVNGFYAIKADNTSVTEDYNLLDATRGGSEILGIPKGPHDVSGDPKFNNPDEDDFTIAFNSPAVDKGVPDPGGGPYSDDYAGVARPQPPGGSWDIGAYEYLGGDTTPPAPPRGLRVR